MRSLKLPFLIAICLQAVAISVLPFDALAEIPTVDELVWIPEKNWQSDFAAWYEGRRESFVNQTSEREATPHCMMAKKGDRFHFRNFHKASTKDGTFSYERVDFVLDDQLLRADFEKGGIRLTGRLKRGDPDEWVHCPAAMFGQLGWIGPRQSHSLRTVLASDQSVLRKEQGEVVVDCKLQFASGNPLDTQLRFRQIGPHWLLNSIRQVGSDGFSVQIRDIEYIELDDLWIVKSCLREAGTTSDGIFRATARDSIRLSDFKREFSPQLLEIEELQDGMPVEVADLPVACEYRDHRIVVSSLANIGQAIETNSYVPTWTNRLPVIFFAVLLLFGMALLAYKATRK